VGEGAVAPKGIVCVRIDPSVLAIPQEAFAERTKLKKVQLHDGLREIGLMAFNCCTALNGLQLSDEVQSIRGGAFQMCLFTKFRIPPLVTTILNVVLNNCVSMFSLELPDNINRIEWGACSRCYSLRNIALASHTVVEDAGVDHSAFSRCLDLLSIFGTQEAIIIALQHRFDQLPFHSKMYYKTYYDQITAEEFLNTIVIGENGELDPSGLQQDCLGMTPIHILACSTVQCLELYQLMIEKYPENLIVTDAWGALPLLYAVWGDAPSEIVHFLVNSYQSLYPEHEFDWDAMVITLGQANASKDVIRNLLDIQQTLSTGQTVNWDSILEELAKPSATDDSYLFSRAFCFLIRCSTATRVNAIGVKHFREAMSVDWAGLETDHFNKQAWLSETRTELEYYESEYRKLKEMTSLLELALWKARISNLDHGKVIGGGNKKLKVDQSEFRSQCRVSCGADQVVENVWPYLLPPDIVRSHIDEDNSDDDEDDDDNDDDVEDDDDDSFDNDSDEDEDNDKLRILRTRRL
jgi:hypothetical protein